MPLNQAYKLQRKDILEVVPTDAKTILDVGCSIGSLGRAIKERQSCEVTGLELNAESGDVASHFLDKVIIGNVDEIDLTHYKIPKRYFDCIIYGDVLEHCLNPWQIVQTHKDYLKDNGTVIVSFPNVRHYTLIFNLLKGDFPYRERGLHDKSHIRWFTKKTMMRLLSEANYSGKIVKRQYRLVENNIYSNFATRANYLAPYVANLLYPFRDFFVFQYIIICKKH
jgi:2-polyprenyl-3-methyl-5-hydroxy-6-metoxy-1,4-benzoquinol methylase